MNESKQEPETSSKETSAKKISSHEMMLESKVPQYIKETLASLFSSINTDISEARQHLLKFLLMANGKPNKDVYDPLVLVLKGLDKAKHTISKKIFSEGVLEPSDAVDVEEGAITQSPSDAVAAQEIPASTCNASASSQLLMSAGGSCEDKINLPVEKVSVHDSAAIEAMNDILERIETTMDKASINDFSVGLALRKLSEDELFASLSKASSLDEHDSAEGLGTEEIKNIEGHENNAVTCNVSAASEPLIGVQAFSEDNINLPVEGVSALAGHDPVKACTADGTTNIKASEINASIHDVSTASASEVEGECGSTASRNNVTADSELVVALQESPVVEELFLQDVHEPVKAVAVRENSKDDITPTVEMAFSLAGHQIAKSEATEGGNDIDECGMSASRCSAIGALELVTEMDSSENNATLLVDPSLNLPELTEGGKTSIDKSEITTSTGNVTAASDLVMAEEMSSEDNKRVPIRKRTYMDLRVLTKGVHIDDTAVVDASEITTSTCNVAAASELTAVEDYVSEITIALPLEHSSSRNVKDSSEVSSTQTSSQNIITGQDIFIAGDEYFEGTILCVKKLLPLWRTTRPARIRVIVQHP